MDIMDQALNSSSEAFPYWTFREQEWFLVASSTLKERYNRALEVLCGRRTSLERFHIDMTGFSPEVAREFGDELYLNPHGINRRFILLVPEQRDLTVKAPMFSWTAEVMQRFMEENRDELFALMARDAAYGEFENSIYRLESIDEVLELRAISMSVQSPQGVVEAARLLEKKIGSIGKSVEDWLDDRQLNELIRLAAKAGDVRRHPIIPQQLNYSVRHFFTHHFGGVYRFDHGRRLTVLTLDPDIQSIGLGDANVQHHRLTDSPHVCRYLTDRRLVQHQQDRDVLRELIRGFLLDIHVQECPETDFSTLDESGEKNLIHRHWDTLPKTAKTVLAAIRHLEQGLQGWDDLATDEAFFYLVEPKGGEMEPLIHHLLANYRPQHYRYLYRWNRALFWKHFAQWPRAKQEYVANYIARFGDRRPDSTAWSTLS